MARASKLTPEQWALARQRWEGVDAVGFAWLAREIEAAWGVQVLRKSLEQWARAKGWEKGGPLLAELPRMDPPKGAIPAGEGGGKIPEGGGGKIPEAGPGAGNIPQQPAPEPETAAPPQPGPEVASEVVYAPDKPAVRGPGRPSSYRPEFAAALIAYFDKEPFELVDVTQPSGLVKKQRLPTDPPMLQGFAASIGVSKATVDNWATAINSDGSPRYPDFCEAYARARASQEALMARAGLLGLYDSRFTSFALKNLCGWQDQPAPKVDQAAVSKEALDRLFGERMDAARQRAMAVLQERRELRRLADEAAGVAPVALAAEPAGPEPADGELPE